MKIDDVGKVLACLTIIRNAFSYRQDKDEQVKTFMKGFDWNMLRSFRDKRMKKAEATSMKGSQMEYTSTMLNGAQISLDSRYRLQHAAPLTWRLLRLLTQRIEGVLGTNSLEIYIEWS